MLNSDIDWKEGSPPKGRPDATFLAWVRFSLLVIPKHDLADQYDYGFPIICYWNDNGYLQEEGTGLLFKRSLAWAEISEPNLGE